ncbi:MAG TPA: amino acid adenylation domain-containing protein, partial [Methylocystis sp.]|nr:amino acid adenylation domain-containing protein [Methylocystis sp.]
MLIDWNATAADHPQDKSLHELFEAQAAQAPEKIAVVFEDAQLSYGELNAKTNKLAHYLRRRGVGPDAVVGVCAERSLEMVIGLLGILKAGGAYLPLDPSYPQERLAYMIEDAKPVLMLTQAGLRGDLAQELETLRLDADWSKVANESEANPPSGAAGQNLAYVIYTSGSTGRPKGVGVSHEGIVNRLAWMQARYGLGDDDVVLQKTPYSFDVSVWEFFWPLSVGSRLAVARPDDHREPARLARLIERHRVTTLHFVPSMLQSFLGHSELSSLASLRRVLCSGEALAGSLRDQFFGAHGVELHNLYGPTEASIDVTAYASAASDRDGNVSIGRPIWNTQIYLLDAGLNPVPQGVAGELYIGGVGLARGYVNRPDLTAERFVPNPFGESGTRLYRTGDLARHREDGNIEFLGRVDHQVKIRGLRIELGEIEAALARVEGVREAIVVAREDGAAGKRLIAYVTARESARLEAAALGAALQRELPDYMVPSAFVMLEALPLTSNGKVDRKALPSPDFEARAAHAYAAPRNATEETLCRIWAETLGVERVGIEDNFFELGGDSLLSVRAVGLAKKRGVELTVQSIYKTPTIRKLVESHDSSSLYERIDRSTLPFALAPQSDRELLPAGLEDAYPLTELQLGMIYHSHSGDHRYHMVDSMTLKCAFDEPSLRAAVNALMRAHPILRTAFDLGAFSTPLQLV